MTLSHHSQSGDRADGLKTFVANLFLTMSYPRTPMADNANARKRAIDTVDLTGDDDMQPSSKAPRSTSPLPSSPVPVQPSQTQPTGSQPIQSQSHSWIEDEANNTIMVPQETDEGPDFEQWELYGTSVSPPFDQSKILKASRYHAHQNCWGPVLQWVRH